MIDSTKEALIPLAQVPAVLPRLRRGRKVHRSSVYRWSTKGCRGVQLESLQCAATRCTSRAALQRFFERLSNVRQGTPRQRQNDKAARRLQELGI